MEIKGHQGKGRKIPLDGRPGSRGWLAEFIDEFLQSRIIQRAGLKRRRGFARFERDRLEMLAPGQQTRNDD